MLLILIACVTKMSLQASDSFPTFGEYSYAIAIPTNIVGCQIDTNKLVGTNLVYSLVGQVFSNSSLGHIQTLAEGFSGTTDRATPWKIITEMLAVSQQGAVSNKMSSLYSVGSQSYIDSIYTNATTFASFRAFSTSITNMQALMGYEASGGFIAITSIQTTDSAVADILPFYLVKSNNVYLLSSFDSSDSREANIGVFLNSHSVTNLLK